MISRRELLAFWERRFEEGCLDSPRLSSQVLLAHVLNLPRLEMLLDPRAIVSSAAAENMERLARRRLRSEPVAYLVGVKEFYGLDFEVNPGVLIPRPETELMVDRLRETFSPSACKRLLDLGTGSGALAVTCAKVFPHCRIVASDISMAALCTARRNAVRHDVCERVSFVRSDLVDAVRLDEFDVILANLPYVPAASRATMSREVLDHEPESALFAGGDGLDMYRRLACDVAGRVAEGTRLLCEIDHTQGAGMQGLFERVARSVSIEKDYAGYDRLVVVVF